MRQPKRRTALLLTLAVALLFGLGVLWVLFLRGAGSSLPEWREADGHRWAELVVPSRGGPGFTRLPARFTGIEFANVVTEEQWTRNSHTLNGSGVAVGDYDGDGRPDVYFASMDGPNVLYRNRGGWRFEDVTGEAGVAAPDRFSTGAAFADVDGDGDLDLLVTALGGPDALFRNEGNGRFVDATREAGLEARAGSTSMALADVEGDGDLDLYVAVNKTATLRDVLPPEARHPNALIEEGEDGWRVVPEMRGHYELGEPAGDYLPVLEVAEPDRFYLNDGSGRFVRVPFTGGRFLDPDGRPLEEEPRDWALSARFQDIDGDGDPDLYVCNDFQSPDHVWLNDGHGRFRILAPEALRTTSAASMGVDFSDIERDGDLDFLVVEMLSRSHALRARQVREEGRGLTAPRGPLGGGRLQVPRNTLLMGRGDGTWAEIARYAGLAASEWSWFGLFLDVDLDGYEDVLVGNGHFYDAMDRDAALRAGRAPDWRRAIALFPPLATENLAFRNRGDRTFEEAGPAWGFGGEADVSHGAATGDLDGDGDLDVVINRLGDPAAVLRNEATAPRVAVRLRGSPPNTRGIGARVRLLGGPVPQEKEIVAGGTYLSGSEPAWTFAAGEGERDLTLVVEWRSGRTSRIEGVRPDRIYEVFEEGAGGAGEAVADVGRPTPFEHVADLPSSARPEPAGGAGGEQPLMSRRLDRLGPGLAWYDHDGDGDEDLLVAGEPGRPTVFRNDAGRMVRVGGGPAGRPGAGAVGRAAGTDGRTHRADPADRGMAGIVGWEDGRGGRSVVVGRASRAGGSVRGVGGVNGPAPSAVRYVPAPGGALRPEAILPASPGNGAAGPASEAAAGPLAAADYDGDGDLDLFVGGRALPGRHPLPPASRLLRNDGGRLVEDHRSATVLETAGLVSGAVFSDVDGDGDPDLVLAVEWGPVRVLENRSGRFVDATRALGLDRHTGWWNGVAAGDLDGDGRIDLVATNWGLNTSYGASPERPALVYHGDFDNDGIRDLLEGRHDPAAGAVVPLADLRRLAGALPFLRGRVRSFEHFGTLGVETILAGRLERARVDSATTLAHTLLLARGEGFESVPLPPEAQLAPAFGVVVADFDGDGAEDVFLAHNFSAVRDAADRAVAGRGLWLRGDGAGGLEAVPGHRSGIRVPGDGRGAAAADFDGDGRLDLAVAQSGGPTRLYRNAGAAPGLRVRLAGPVANPRAVGATLRVVYGEPGAGERLGPLHEVHAGSGYWSQDGAVRVLGLAGEPRALRVRWPGGREVTVPVPPGEREVIVRP